MYEPIGAWYTYQLTWFPLVQVMADFLIGAKPQPDITMADCQVDHLEQAPVTF